MFVYLLLAGGMLLGSAAFAGAQAYLLAGIALAALMAVAGGRLAWIALGGEGTR